MTTLFEESDNTNPPSPSLGLLDASSLKSELDAQRKAVTNSSAETEEDLSSEPDGVEQDQPSNQNLGNSFTSFVDDANQLSNDVRVVHVQTVPDGNNQNNGSQVSTSTGGALYAVGNGGQLQQVITPGDPGLATVSVDHSTQDGARYTYYPAVQTNDGNQGGQFYVMMSPQEVIPVAGNNTPRIIAPRSQSLTSKVEGSRTSRDERRRATHNEVERRRRDKINTWIMKIAAVVPDCQMDQSKQGTSKGGVLSKALDHICKLRQENERMRDTIKEQERILVENQVLRQQVEKLRQENAILQTNIQLRQSGEQIAENETKLEND